jgi:5-methylcytosine-specific restriction endonuclease McrA/DNA-binding MarR family transcriptional regulator
MSEGKEYKRPDKSTIKRRRRRYRYHKKRLFAELWDRQPHKCAYCEAEFNHKPGEEKRDDIPYAYPVIDHIMPLCLGGSPTDTENLILCCNKCNDLKGTKDPEDFMRMVPELRQKRKDCIYPYPEPQNVVKARHRQGWETWKAEEEPVTEEVRYKNVVNGLGFADMKHAMTLDTGLSDGAYRTYALYLKYAQQSSSAWPGRERMARERGKSTAAISRHNKELEDLGYIERIRRTGTSSVTLIENPSQHQRLVDLATEYRQKEERRKNATSHVVDLRRQPSHKRDVEEEEVEEEEVEERAQTAFVPPASKTEKDMALHEFSALSPERQKEILDAEDPPFPYSQEFLEWWTSQVHGKVEVVPPFTNPLLTDEYVEETRRDSHDYLDELAQEKGYKDYPDYYEKEAMGTFEDTPSVEEDDYERTIHYKDESVTAIGRVREGPWNIKCHACGENVFHDKLSRQTESAKCLCGMHAYIITLSKPEKRSLRERYPESVELYYTIAASRGVRRPDKTVEEFHDEITKTVQNLPFFKEVMVAWVMGVSKGGKPYNPRNVGGILQCYEDARLPGQNKPTEEVKSERQRQQCLLSRASSVTSA